MSVNFQYSTAYCVSYSSSTKTLMCEVLKPRVPWSVPVKTFVGTGVETFTKFILACEGPDPCNVIETFCLPVGIL